MRRTWIAVALTLSALTGTARAQTTLDIPGWLARPGVKAVAVEFYASWCKPCMEAMPRWKELQKRYGREGLKVIVVNTRDASGGCANLGWKPDQVVCDLDGVVSEQLGVQDLPAAFLWSWQGNLLVQGGHIGEVEAAVEREMIAVPRVAIRAEDGLPPTVVGALKQRLTDTGKLVVIADEAERAELAKMRLAQQKATVKEEARCELGNELPPNTLLKVAKVNGGHDDYLSFELFDVEKGCQSAATSVAWDATDPALSVRDGVENLLAKLRRSTPEWPTAQEAKPSASPVPSNRTGTLVVSSNVDGAMLTIDGTPRPDPVGRVSLELKPGEHRVRVSKSGFLDDLRTVSVMAGGRATFDAKLVAEKREEARRTIAGDDAALLQIDTVPRDAVIVIDDVPRGRAPGNFELTPGAHVVRARLEWYREAVATVRLEAGLPLAKTLELAADFGRLEVTSTTPGVSVFLDDESMGTADPTARRPRVAPGTYRVRATLADHHEQAETVRIVAGETARVTIPAMRSSIGTLEIRTEPPGATLELDGEEVGESPMTIARLANGTHELKVSLAEHLTIEQPVQVVQGQKRTVTLKLESKLTTLEVTSTPVPGTVYVDDRKVGVAPVSVRVEEGDHQVRVEADPRAYRAWSGRVTAARGVKARALAELVPRYGVLVVTSLPFHGAVRIDGRPEGETPLKVSELLGGPYVIEVSLDGYQTVKREIVIEAERLNKLDLTLLELLPEELAAKRIAAWARRTEPQRSHAARLTTLSVGSGALAVASVVAALAARDDMNTATAAYGASTGPDAAAKYDSLKTAWMTMLGWSGAGVVSTGLSVWSGIKAHAAWADVPARPVFEIRPGGGRVGVEATW